MEEIINKIKDEAESYFENSCPSHDWSHVERVHNLAVYIGKNENADLFIIRLAALLHDVGRQKEEENPDKFDHAEISAEIAKEIMKKNNLDEETINKVLHCILSHRFRKDNKPETKEAQVLFDADKLDSIGAIGIARAYCWAGNKKLKIYSDKDYLGTGYEKEHSPMTEFAYKLNNVKEKLLTESAKKIANERHNFMSDFFDRLEKEIKTEL